VPSPRRFPPPWSVEETDSCFIVRDGKGQALAYVYFEKEPGKARGAEAPHPRRGPAHRANIAKLPDTFSAMPERRLGDSGKSNARCLAYDDRDLSTHSRR
jgi:hypothetical protein